MSEAMNVADAIITFANDSVFGPVTNLKLQKVMYFLNALSLLDDNRKFPLIDSNQPFEKWDYGPVNPPVYREYAENGKNEILQPSPRYILNEDDFSIQEVRFELDDITNAQDLAFISENIDIFLRFDVFELVNFSHLEDQWRERNNIIYDNQRTFEFYSQEDNRFWER